VEYTEPNESLQETVQSASRGFALEYLLAQLLQAVH